MIDSINVSELARWLIDHDKAGALSAPRVFLDIEAKRRERHIDGDETITLNELTAALIASGAADDSAKRAARKYVLNAMNRREQPWKAGDVVRDKIGRVFVRLEGDIWSRAGSNLTWSEDQPIRPLTYLKEAS
jgi:hypothetical protein